MTKNKNNMTGNMIGNFMGTMVALPLVGASASMANSLPAGTAKDLAGAAVGLQGVALMGHSLGAMPKNMMPGNVSRNAKKVKKSKWM